MFRSVSILMIPEISHNPVTHDALPLQLMMVTGTSGSGKTQALKCLEDLGFFCVDNLPPALFQTFTELCTQPGKDVKKVALGIDIRERAFFDDLLSNLESLQSHGSHVELLFLEAQDEILVRRFSESRRPHPLLPHRRSCPENFEPVHARLCARPAVPLPIRSKWPLFLRPTFSAAWRLLPYWPAA